MNNRDFYKCTFSQLHSSKTIKWEEMRQRAQTKGKKRPVSYLVLLAAVIGLLALLGCTAMAVNFLGLRDALLPRQKDVGMIDPDTGLTVPGEKVQIDVISLSGFADTPESKALAEWQAFLEDYDPDKAILNRVGNTLDPVLFEKYGCYAVYTREMGEKLEEIARKYGLSLHTEEIDLCAHPEALGPLSGFAGNNEAYWTYMYEDGTCHFDGYACVEGWRLVDIQFQRSVKGSFNTALLSVVDVTDYQEWSYQTKSGMGVLLAMGPGKSLILADLPDSFVVFNVFIGTDGEMTRQRLEAVADCYDFSLLTPAVKPQVEEKPVQARSAGSPRKVFALALWELWNTGVFPDGSQAEYYGSDEAMGGNQFAVYDVDGDGTEDLIISYTNTYTAAQRSYVIGYDPYYTGAALPIFISFTEFPTLNFYDNGMVEALASHNQTWGELWPYTLYGYDRENGSFHTVASVYSADRALMVENGVGDQYPAEKDICCEGTLYYVSFSYGSGVEPAGTRIWDQEEYDRWRTETIGDAQLLNLSYTALTEENIRALTDEPLPVYPHAMPAG